MNGGEAIGAGGYGCVFRPALNCKSNIKNNLGSDYISKLLINKYADEELDQMDKVKDVLVNIPNNNKYFLIQNISSCKPDNLLADDLKNIDICSKFFEKNDIDINNINNTLDKFTIINSPYAGNDLDKYIYSDKFNIDNFKIINNLLIDLLENAIVPMNKLDLIHMDLKDQNLLYDNKSIKIIDWGLAYNIKNNNYQYNEKNFSTNLYRRPLQFNLPYSILLLNNDFWKDFLNYLNYYTIIDKKILNKETFKEIFKNIFNNFFENRKYGHSTDLINTIIPLFYNNLNSEENKFNKFIDIMVNIYTHIFLKYFDINQNIFKINDYIKNVYLFNCDIFGLLSTYISIYESLKLKKKGNIEPIKNLVLKYMFDETFYTKPYNIANLIKDLKDLNNLNLNLNLKISTIKTRKKKNKVKKLISNNKSKKVNI